MIKKRLLFGAMIIVATFTLTGCNENEMFKSTEEMILDYEKATGVTGSETQAETKVPSLAKCEQILEQWCREFFSDCFNSVSYKENSLSGVRIDDINYDGTIVRLSGQHSIDGAFGENYNDLDFEAKIIIKGGNAYEVWFNRKKAIGGWQSATRTVYL